MRVQGITFIEIGILTGLGTGNAYNAWKRWADAEETNQTRRA
jgi:hypothetical protein